MTKGNLIFSKIDRLPDNWWDSDPSDDPSDVWKVWDRNTYYLWGANNNNYKGIKIGQSLQGDGMAGPKNGPTIGRAHPHYVGVISDETKVICQRMMPFLLELENHLNNGEDVVIPTFHGKFCLVPE